MKRLMLAGLMVGLMAAPVLSQTALYKMRNGQSVTPMGAELIGSMNTLCTALAQVRGHFLAMTRQRDSSSDYSTVAEQWGVLDPSTNAISETHAESLYNEINSMIGNGAPSIEQGCSSVKQ